MPSVDEFRSAIRSQFREAEARCLPKIEINSGQLHRKLGGYPGPKAQMPSCCQAMYHEKKLGDDLDQFLATRFGKRMVEPIKAIHHVEEGRPIEQG